MPNPADHCIQMLCTDGNQKVIIMWRSFNGASIDKMEIVVSRGFREKDS